MPKQNIAAKIGVLIFVLLAGPLHPKTIAVDRKFIQRKLKVVRHFDIPVSQGKPSMAVIPALLSFYGQTNWQIIKASNFTFGEKPDSARVTADDLGMPRHNYELTWKSPQAGKIAVEQTLDVELTWIGTLYTQAKSPYDPAVLTRYAASMGPDAKEGINPANPDLVPLCSRITAKSQNAEEVVEGVCDWINDNIKFVMGQRTSDEALSQRQGSCTPMSKLACSMLRHIGIPAETVDAKFIGSDHGHTFIEVFFPDAGWIFYDLSNWNRGFKSLDCLMTVGFAFRSGPLDNLKWTEGQFCEEKDSVPFSENDEKGSQVIRQGPENMDVTGVRVVPQKPPANLKCRMRPLREMILDPKTAGGV